MCWWRIEYKFRYRSSMFWSSEEETGSLFSLKECWAFSNNNLTFFFFKCSTKSIEICQHDGNEPLKWTLRITNLSPCDSGGTALWRIRTPKHVFGNRLHLFSLHVFIKCTVTCSCHVRRGTRVIGNKSNRSWKNPKFDSLENLKQKSL